MSDTRLSVTKRVGNKLSDYVYHRFHRKRTAQILENIGAAAGKINPKLIRLSDEYARDVLGWGGYAPWLYVYSAMQNTFKEGWIPDNYYGRIVVPMLKGQYSATSELKTLHRKLFSGHSAGRGNGSVFPDLVYSTNGLLFSNEYTMHKSKTGRSPVIRA